MNDNLNIFEQALDKLAFRQPVAVEAKRFALSNKRKVLELTLKEFGDYSIFYGLTLRIYFYTKRLGISLSVLQSKIILLIMPLIAAGAIFSGILLFTDILKRDASILKNTSIMPSYNEEKPIKKEQQPEKETGAKSRLGIERFSSEVIDETRLNNITDNITGQILKRKGKDRVINLRKGEKNKNVNMILSGSIEQLGAAYIITSRIIDVETSRVLFIISEEIKDIDRIDEAISNIAEKTAKQIE